MKSFRRFVDDLLGIDGDQFAFMFEDSAVDNHGVDIERTGLLDQQEGGVDEWRDVDVVGSDQN